jgi:hypothetical protein
MQQERFHTGLSEAEWDAFKVNFVGNADTLLAERLRPVKCWSSSCNDHPIPTP